jgi:hypothetical protein
MTPASGIAQSTLFAVAVFAFSAGFILMTLVGPLGGLLLRMTLMKQLLGGSGGGSDAERGSIESLMLLISIMAGTWTLFIFLPDGFVFGLICLSGLILAVRKL